MKAAALILSFWFAVSASAADLGVTVKQVGPTLDKLLERSPKDHRHPHLTVWTLYGQADTSVYLTHNPEGVISAVMIQFYLGWDKDREAHFNQCLPVARFLIHTFMRKQPMSLADVREGLREIEHTRNIKEFREADRVMFFRYKMASSLPEEQDGYRCFRIEIGGVDTQPSTDT